MDASIVQFRAYWKDALEKERKDAFKEHQTEIWI